MDRRSPYQILEIPVGAAEKEIRKAYRRLAMKYHPDRNPGNPEAEEKFKEAQRAHETFTGGSRGRENPRVAAPRWGFDNQSSDLGDPFLGFFMAMETLFPGDQKIQQATRNKQGGKR